MEELLTQEVDCFGPSSLGKVSDYGQSWEQINKGMRKALLLLEQRNEMQAKYAEKTDGLIAHNLPKIGSVMSKKASKETLRVSVNECVDSRERLKIIRTINQDKKTESYRHKLANTNHPEDSFGFCSITKGQDHPTRVNIVRLNVGETDKDSENKEERQYLKAIIKASKRKKINEKENLEDLCKKNVGLNVIKQQSFERQQRCKSHSEPNYIPFERNHSQGFDKIAPSQHEQVAALFLAVQQNPSNFRRGRQKLPVINMDEFQRQRKCSLSIHATSSHHKLVKIHRSLPKNQGRYFEKKDKQLIVRHKQQKQKQQARKDIRILLNPRLSRLKLVI